MKKRETRRTFLKHGTLLAAGLSTALGTTRAVGANERIRVGFIGVGGRSGSLIRPCLQMDDVEIVAMADCYQKHLDRKAAEVGGKVDVYADFRELLDRKDVDAVFIVTPDHWHAVQSIMACESGKDVFVEKPMTLKIAEGRRMVEAARKQDRVVQMGAQHRSRKDMPEIRKLIEDDVIGKVTVIRAYRKSNMFPEGIGNAPDSDPPEGFNWDMWLGPAAWRPYRTTIAPYKFRWWKEYSSQLGNWGVHHFDIVRAILDEVGPTGVTASGGKFALTDDRTIPDTMEVTYQFASGRVMTFGMYEANGNKALPEGGTELRGTKGTLCLDWDGYKVIPEKGGQMQDWEPGMAEIVSKDSAGDDTFLHIRNFFDCMRSRKRPTGDVEEGHRSTTMCHLGNIAFDLQQRLDWNPETERFTNSEEANRMLDVEYREPWKVA